MDISQDGDRVARDWARIRRIHIIGGPGSGKSTLAQELGTALNLSVHDLDSIAFEGKEFRERAMDRRREDVRRIAARSEWITEGIFIEWVEELLERADVIIWLDGLPWHQAAGRIVRRFVRLGYNELRSRRGHEKFFRFQDYGRHLRQLGAVMFTSHSYYNDISQSVSDDARSITRVATAAALARYQSKVIRCRSAEAVRQFVAHATQSQAPALSLIVSTGPEGSD